MSERMDFASDNTAPVHETRSLVRFVTSFATDEQSVSDLVDAVAAACR